MEIQAVQRVEISGNHTVIRTDSSLLNRAEKIWTSDSRIQGRQRKKKVVQNFKFSGELNRTRTPPRKNRCTKGKEREDLYVENPTPQPKPDGPICRGEGKLPIKWH